MSDDVRNVIIIGSGCAGHTAAVYAARAVLSPLVLEGKEPGGQLTLTTIVENYPGFPEGVDGFTLVDSMKKQAVRFGAEYKMETVDDVDLSKRPFKIVAGSKTYHAKTLIIASGARARLMGTKGEDTYFSKGVHTCATCDGAIYRDKKIAVVGGGDTSMEDSLFLTRFASEVHIFCRRDKLRASQIMQKRAIDNPKITIHWNTELEEIYGENDRVTGVKTIAHPEGNPSQKVKDAGSTEAAGVTTGDFSCDGIFIAIGHIPNIEFLKDQLKTTDDGYIIPKPQEGKCATCDVWTDVAGVFAAGDVVDYHFQQAITAAGMGCKAAMAAEEFLGMEE